MAPGGESLGAEELRGGFAVAKYFRGFVGARRFAPAGNLLADLLSGDEDRNRNLLGDMHDSGAGKDCGVTKTKGWKLRPYFEVEFQNDKIESLGPLR